VTDDRSEISNSFVKKKKYVSFRSEEIKVY